MKHLHLLIVAAFCSLCLGCGRSSSQDNKQTPCRAFMNVKWGMAPEEVEEAVPCTFSTNKIGFVPLVYEGVYPPLGSGVLEWWDAKETAGSFGVYPIYRAHYEFFKGRLFAYRLQVGAPRNELEQTVNSQLDKRFGRPTNLLLMTRRERLARFDFFHKAQYDMLDGNLNKFIRYLEWRDDSSVVYYYWHENARRANGGDAFYDAFFLPAIREMHDYGESKKKERVF